MTQITKESVLREIPLFSNGDHTKVRPAFRELHRVLISQKLSPSDLDFLKREIIARKKRLGFDDEGA